MDDVPRADLNRLAAERDGPCVSLYQPMHAAYPETKEDPIRFRGLLDEAETRLTNSGVQSRVARAILEPARELAGDKPFWKSHGSRGLAALATHDGFRSYRLSYACPETVDVGARYYLTPLAHALMHLPRFLLLALTPNQVRLYRCNSHEMAPVDLPSGMMTSLSDMSAGEVVERALQYHTSAGFGTVGSLQGTPHGHGDPRDDYQQLMDDFCHIVARELDPLFAREDRPVVLAAVDYLHPMFHKACRSPRLLGDGVVGSPDELTEHEMFRQALPLAESWNRRGFEREKRRFLHMQGTERAASRPEGVVPAAHDGRIWTLFAALDARIWGRFDPATYEVAVHQQHQTGDTDLVNFAIGESLAADAEVYVVPQDEMPGEHPVAAIFRW